MSERIELPEIKVSPIGRVAVAGRERVLLDPHVEHVPEIARRCNSWPELADNVACLLSAIEHFVDKDVNYDIDMAPHIKELERLIGGEV